MIAACERTESEVQARLRTFTEEQKGRLGEDIWKNVLKWSGWFYIPLTLIDDGGAPMAKNNGEVIILPDYQACLEGKTVFVEAKAKSQSIVYRNNHQERHGINQRNYEHYVRAAKESDHPCAIAIVELWREIEGRGLEWSGSLLIETLRDLGQPRSEYPEHPPKVYWPRKRFRDLDSMSAVELLALAKGTLQRSYKYELDSLFRPWNQKGLFD